MATPKKVGGHIWNQEMARARYAHTTIRSACGRLLELIQERPFQVMVAAITIGHVLTASGECLEALAELERIEEAARESQA